MSKPLTTLGEALMAKGGGGEELDWRSLARANGIERRAPPSGQPMDVLGRPDRGYVEQPEERVPPKATPAPESIPPRSYGAFPPQQPRLVTPDQIAPFMRRRTETPTLTAPVALIRPEYSEQPLMDEKEEQMPLQQDTEPANVATQPSPAPEGSEMPRKRKKRVEAPDQAYRDKYAIRILRASLNGVEARANEVKAVFEETGVSRSGVSRWVQLYQASHPRWKRSLSPASEQLDQAPPPPSRSPGDPSSYTLERREAEALRVLRKEVFGTELALKLGVTGSAVYQWVAAYKRKYPDWKQRLRGASATLVSSPVSGPVSIPASINGAGLPPLPVITVAGIPNPAFEITGLAEWCQAMIQLGVKAELKRRLGDD